MRSKVLTLCLMGSLFANNAYSFSKQTKWTVGISVGVVLILVGSGATLVGFLPRPLGDAGHWGPRWCGDDETLCVDSCTFGCTNLRLNQCEPFSGPTCHGNRFCTHSIDSYRFVNSTTECRDNPCIYGDGACIAKGKEVVPWNLFNPQPHFLGNKWGFAPAVLGPIGLVGGIITTWFFVSLRYCTPHEYGEDLALSIR